MSDSTTIARPYAKAAFEYALAEGKLADWSIYLSTLSQVILTPDVAQFIANPASTPPQHAELLQAAIESDVTEKIDNFISLLATNKRLMLLPEIYALYEFHRAEQEKTLDVEVRTYSELSAAQQQRLIDSLSQRLQRQVALKINIDSSLLGGAIIRAGDLVIDGSVRGKLNKMSNELAA